MTGIGTSVPILRLVFLPSAARSRGEARIFTPDVGLQEAAVTVDGMLTTKSATFSDESRWARTLVKPPLSSPAAPVGEKVTAAV